MKLTIPEGDIFNVGKESNTDKKDNASKTASTSTSASIKIIKKKFKENKTLVGWRINSSTVDKIKECAFDSRMGINEFVQELLDKALEDIYIE